jgi:hypothetical protein
MIEDSVADFYLHMDGVDGCDKSPRKTPFLNPTKSMAGSHRSGRVKR